MEKTSAQKSAAKYRKAKRIKLRELGICQACHKVESPIGLCDTCADKAKKWRDKNRERVRAYGRAFNHRARMAILEWYGGACACCGERQPAFLSIDHIQGGGRKHVREIKASLLHWLYRHKKRIDGFQLLCFNCNWAKHALGECPHKKVISEPQ